MLYVAIGRDIGGTPMPGEQWLELQDEVIQAVGGRPDTIAHGRSFWRSDSEDTCVFVWFGIDELRELGEARLRDLAGDYGQDAIAWVAGATQFAEPWKK